MLFCVFLFYVKFDFIIVFDVKFYWNVIYVFFFIGLMYKDVLGILGFIYWEYFIILVGLKVEDYSIEFR